MDRFYEQYLVKQVNIVDKSLLFARNCLFLLSLLCFMLLRLSMALIFALFWVFIFMICRNVFVDYEYELTNQELTITKIYHKRRRKTMACVKKYDFISMKRKSELASSDHLIHCTLPQIDVSYYFFKTSVGVIGFALSLDEEMKTLLLDERKENTTCQDYY